MGVSWFGSIEENWQRLNQSTVVLRGSLILFAVGAVVGLVLGERPMAGTSAVLAITNAYVLARKRRSGKTAPAEHRSGRLTRR